MSFTVRSLGFFKKEIEKLDKKSKRIIYDKIRLIKENPYRYKKIHSELYSNVFRIRINIKNQETRLIYVIIKPNIILVCLLSRKRDYKDLKKYLLKIREELNL